jgi:hypothetical protein
MAVIGSPSRKASKLYHAKDYDGMLALLIPLHQKMNDVCMSSLL